MPNNFKLVVSSVLLLAPTAPKPQGPDVTITMREYAFEMDSTLSAGSHVVELRNTGHQGHLVLFVRLAPEKTSKDVVEWLAHRERPAPGEIVLTTPEVKPGGATVVSVNLSPGRYSLVCPVRGWWNRPHFKSGMTRDIVVAER
jgi:hypothetical protein